jgi:hypothetical protein
MRPLYTSVRMLDASPQAPLSATFRHVFDDYLGSSHSLQVQWASSNGNSAGAFCGDCEGEWREPPRAPRQIDGFVHHVFSSLLETQGGASGLCCFGLQAGGRTLTLHCKMPSNLGRARRGTGVDHSEGAFSPGGPGDHDAEVVALSSFALSISGLLPRVPASHRMEFKTGSKVRLFQGDSSHFVSFCPIHFYLSGACGVCFENWSAG